MLTLLRLSKPCLAAAALALTWLVLPAAAETVVTTEHVRAELLAHAPHGVAPGRPVWLALAIEHRPHWHSYWRNPGDSGLPTTLSWQLSHGATVGDIAWPTPQAMPVGPLINYGYEGTVLLPVPVTVPASFGGRELLVALQAEWLVCKDVCVPESGEFALRLSTRTATAVHARRFEDALARVPVEPANVHARASIARRALAVEVDGLPSDLHGRELRFFAETAGVVEHAAAIEQRWDAGRWLARVPLAAHRSESPQAMHVVLVAQGRTGAIRLRVPISGSWSRAAQPPMPALSRAALIWPLNARASASMASAKE
jgi:thiol:disulfide interchange protein DsbD